MNTIQQDVDERSSLAGTNKFELLLFKLGISKKGENNDLFGINVFKIREIVAMPQITPIAGSSPHILGVVNLRGEIIQVIDLPAIVGCVPETGLNIMLVTEFARTTQAFAVESVEEIVRLDWSQVLSAEHTAGASMVASIARLDGNVDHSRLAQVLDIETIVRSINPSDAHEFDGVKSSEKVTLLPGQVILAADDSTVARALIEQGLVAMGLPFIMVKSGKEAWDKLAEMFAEAEAKGKKIEDLVALVLTDLEMPEMDGFTLTRNIKQSSAFKHLPVVIHSSLSGSTNEAKVREVGADGYVAKFVATELAASLLKALK